MEIIGRNRRKLFHSIIFNFIKRFLLKFIIDKKYLLFGKNVFLKLC